MNVFWSNEIDNILNLGVSLEEIGINNWALTREDALNALCSFEKLDIGVLGGDVYIHSNGDMAQNYDSWYCNYLSGESRTNFVTRSINKAKSYILGYSTANAMFVLIPAVGI
jgi:hypothetical protein